MKKNIVKLRGISKIAKSSGLYIKAAKLNDNTYVTGQGIIPSDPESVNNLTLDEMTGKKPLSDEKARRFPFIINPFEIYNFPDGKVFDLDTYEDRAFVEMIKLVGGRVAKSKSEVIRGRHDFYLENKEKEHKVIVSKFEKMIEAGNIIMGLSSDGVFDMASFIGVSKGDSQMLIEMSTNQARALLVKYAQDKPEVIIEGNLPENKIWIQVANLVSSNVLKLNGSDFYEGSTFIASDFDSLVNIYRTDSQKKIRWDKKYRAKNSKKVGFDFNDSAIQAEPTDTVKVLIDQYNNSLISLNLDKVKILHDELLKTKDERAIDAIKKSKMLYDSLTATSEAKQDDNPLPDKKDTSDDAEEIDETGHEVLDMFNVALSNGVISQKGSWYSVGGKKFGPGRNKAIDALISLYKEDPESVTKLLAVQIDNNVI